MINVVWCRDVARRVRFGVFVGTWRAASLQIASVQLEINVETECEHPCLRIYATVDAEGCAAG